MTQDRATGKTQGRETLYGYFKAGQRPTEAQFRDLIDAALIMNDEGFRKTEPDGLLVVTKATSPALLSFQKADKGAVEWSLGLFDGGVSGNNQLVLKRGPTKSDDSATGPNLSVTFGAGDDRFGLQIDARVSICATNDEPHPHLDVAGAISSTGRVGQRWSIPIRADGDWHDITPVLKGCAALEVVAGVRLPSFWGRVALVHALAMNAFNPAWWGILFWRKRPIRCQHAFYGRRSDRLQLRWAPYNQTESKKSPTWYNKEYGRDGQYVLQLRSRTLYGDSKNTAPQIAVFVTKLWYDADSPSDAGAAAAGPSAT